MIDSSWSRYDTHTSQPIVTKQVALIAWTSCFHFLCQQSLQLLLRARAAWVWHNLKLDTLQSVADPHDLFCTSLVSHTQAGCSSTNEATATQVQISRLAQKGRWTGLPRTAELCGFNHGFYHYWGLIMQRGSFEFYGIQRECCCAESILIGLSTLTFEQNLSLWLCHCWVWKDGGWQFYSYHVQQRRTISTNRSVQFISCHKQGRAGLQETICNGPRGSCNMIHTL